MTLIYVKIKISQSYYLLWEENFFNLIERINEKIKNNIEKIKTRFWRIHK